MTSSDLDRLADYARGQLSNRIRDVRLAFRGDGLVLSGRCPSYHLKQLAQQLIMKVVDAPLAANEIEVAERPPGHQRHVLSDVIPASLPRADRVT